MDNDGNTPKPMATFMCNHTLENSFCSLAQTLEQLYHCISLQGPRPSAHITNSFLPVHEELSYTQWHWPTRWIIIETSNNLCTLLGNSEFESSGLWFDLLLFCFFSFVRSFTMTCSDWLHSMWIGLAAGSLIMCLKRLCTDKPSSLWVVLSVSLSWGPTHYEL